MINRKGTHTQQGISLIESMIGLFVLSIVVGAAMPSLQSMRQRADLAGVAAQLETDVQFARSQARVMDRPVRLTLRETGAGTCYMVHTGAAADCSCGEAGTIPTCGGTSDLLRAVVLDPKGDVQVRSASKSVAFDPLKGTVTPTATLRIESRDGRAVHQIVNLLGRVRSCSPQGRNAGEATC